MTVAPTILWIYRDFRLRDNAALNWAAERGPVLPVYIRGESDDEGGASRWWLHRALQVLEREFAKHHVPLILRRGEPLEILRQLARESGAKTVIWARRYAPELAARDKNIALALKADGLEVVAHRGWLLFEPEVIHPKSGAFFKVYTPFSKACLAAPAPRAPLPAPQHLTGIAGIASEALDTWKLVPASAEWPQGLSEAWEVGEEAAQRHLQKFIEEKLGNYKEARDLPAVEGTSRLSPYLHFGHISARQVWHALQAVKASASRERYVLEILWREFSWHLLFHIEDFRREPWQKSFQDFPWRTDAVGLKAWQRGETGYPIVDAGMRQLWKTGWMHNRVRMIVASFLIKDLLIDWRAGMEWFWDTLVDADAGNNTASWQWVAGCGADAAPYYRIFNPTLQGLKFDPNGDYVRRWVPELAGLEAGYIHEPWKAPAEVLAKAGVVLGRNYPMPVVDHAEARERALEALKAGKNKVE